MAYNEDQLQYFLDQMSDFGAFEAKKMFGGIGFFKEGTMFAMMAGNTLRLRVDEHNQSDFENAGMKPYHNPSKKKGMPYWEVPLEVVEDRHQLKKWLEKAYAAALRNKR